MNNAAFVSVSVSGVRVNGVRYVVQRGRLGAAAAHRVFAPCAPTAAQIYHNGAPYCAATAEQYQAVKAAAARELSGVDAFTTVVAADPAHEAFLSAVGVAIETGRVR